MQPKAAERLAKAKEQKNAEFGIFENTEIQKAYDNLKFGKTLKDSPIKTEKYDREIFGYETININPYIEQRVWPRSIYVTDKLVRLAMKARYEQLKKYLAKKRTVSMNMIWLIILLFGAVGVIMVIIFLLPKLGVI